MDDGNNQVQPPASGGFFGRGRSRITVEEGDVKNQATSRPQPQPTTDADPEQRKHQRQQLLDQQRRYKQEPAPAQYQTRSTVDIEISKREEDKADDDNETEEDEDVNYEEQEYDDEVRRIQMELAEEAEEGLGASPAFEITATVSHRIRKPSLAVPCAKPILMALPVRSKPGTLDLAEDSSSSESSDSDENANDEAAARNRKPSLYVPSTRPILKTLPVRSKAPSSSLASPTSTSLSNSSPTSPTSSGSSLAVSSPSPTTLSPRALRQSPRTLPTTSPRDGIEVRFCSN